MPELQKASKLFLSEPYPEEFNLATSSKEKRKWINKYRYASFKRTNLNVIQNTIQVIASDAKKEAYKHKYSKYMNYILIGLLLVNSILCVYYYK